MDASPFFRVFVPGRRQAAVMGRAKDGVLRFRRRLVSVREAVFHAQKDGCLQSR